MILNFNSGWGWRVKANAAEESQECTYVTSLGGKATTNSEGFLTLPCQVEVTSEIKSSCSFFYPMLDCL